MVEVHIQHQGRERATLRYAPSGRSGHSPGNEITNVVCDPCCSQAIDQPVSGNASKRVPDVFRNDRRCLVGSSWSRMRARTRDLVQDENRLSTVRTGVQKWPQYLGNSPVYTRSSTFWISIGRVPPPALRSARFGLAPAGSGCVLALDPERLHSASVPSSSVRNFPAGRPERRSDRGLCPDPVPRARSQNRLRGSAIRRSRHGRNPVCLVPYLWRPRWPRVRVGEKVPTRPFMSLGGDPAGTNADDAIARSSARAFVHFLVSFGVGLVDQGQDRIVFVVSN